MLELEGSPREQWGQPEVELQKLHPIRNWKIGTHKKNFSLFLPVYNRRS